MPYPSSVDAGPQTITNDNAAGGTTVIEATENGSSGTNILIKNDGSAQFAQFVSSVLKTLFQIIPGATPEILFGKGAVLHFIDQNGADNVFARINSNNYQEFLCNASGVIQFSGFNGSALFYANDSTQGNSLQFGPGIVLQFSTGPGPTLTDNILAVDNSSGNTLLGMHRKNNALHIQNKDGNDVAVFDGTSKQTTLSGGIAPINAGFTCFGTGGVTNLLNTTSGTNVTMTAGTIYWAAVFIPMNVTLTGIIFTIGTTGGTDKWIGALYNSAGTLVANSTTSGTTVGTASTKQKLAFVSTYNALGPSVYYVALQSNGTTAKMLALGNATEGFVTGSVAGSFGTLPSITPGSSYTSAVGPFASTY